MRIHNTALVTFNSVNILLTLMLCRNVHVARMSASLADEVTNYTMLAVILLFTLDNHYCLALTKYLYSTIECVQLAYVRVQGLPTRRLELVGLVAASSALSGGILVVGDVDDRSSLLTAEVCGLPPPPSDPLRLLPPPHEASLGPVDTSYSSAIAAMDSVVQRRGDGATAWPNEW